MIIYMFRRIYFLILLNVALSADESESNQFCSVYDEGKCDEKFPLPRYFLYDVNQPEGFNLRRDVYMRMALFVHDHIEKSHEDWHLVLPPWNQLYHWQSNEDEVGPQNQLFWNLFFDISSLQSFIPVVEMYNFINETGNLSVDKVFILQHYPDLFKSSNTEINWQERWEEDDCNQKDASQFYTKLPGGGYRVDLWGYKNITAKDVQCITFQGDTNLFQDILEVHRPRTVIVDHAEVALHSHFGDLTYWRCRRSMRFNKDLIEIASEFRNNYLNSNDTVDMTMRPDDWRDEKSRRNAIGGRYLAVHLRRRDFVHGRKDKVPSIKAAAKQIKHKLLELDLQTVFIATDAPLTEFYELEKYLFGYDIFHYIPSDSVKWIYKDGGVAVIDQIICSHARYFIGTYESTFSFRIQEEREILGFKPETTFNCFCPNTSKCAQPTRWQIVY